MDWANFIAGYLLGIFLVIGAYLLFELWRWHKRRQAYERDTRRRTDEAAARNFLRRRQ